MSKDPKPLPYPCGENCSARRRPASRSAAPVFLPTAAHLDFQRAHALARDAVYAGLDIEGIAAGLSGLGMEAIRLTSLAADRAPPTSAGPISGAGSTPPPAPRSKTATPTWPSSSRTG